MVVTTGYGQPLCSGFAFFIYKKLYFDAADVFQKKNHVIIPIEFNKWILFYLENKKNEFSFVKTHCNL